jgi:hypothetical protein
MRFLGSEFSKRETVFLYMIVLLTLSFFLLTWSFEKTVVDNQNALTECMSNFIVLQSGVQPDYYNFNFTTVGGSNDTICTNC